MRISIVGKSHARFIAEAHRRLALDGVKLCRAADCADALLLLDRRWDVPLRAGVAVIRGDAECRVDARVAISYGMSSRDTLTVSSVSDDGLSLSVQREFPTLDGRVVLIQELTLGWAMPPERALPLAALGLLTGELGESAYAASPE